MEGWGGAVQFACGCVWISNGPYALTEANKATVDKELLTYKTREQIEWWRKETMNFNVHSGQIQRQNKNGWNFKMYVTRYLNGRTRDMGHMAQTHTHWGVTWCCGFQFHTNTIGNNTIEFFFHCQIIHLTIEFSNSKQLHKTKWNYRTKVTYVEQNNIYIYFWLHQTATASIMNYLKLFGIYLVFIWFRRIQNYLRT